MPFHSIYTCGHGAGGRLGLNDEAPRSKFVGPLSTLEGIVVTNLVCGSKHTLVLSRKGLVFSWGYNQYGQVGHGDHGLADWEPRPIKGLTGFKVVQVSAGEDHSVALTDNNEVFSWGRGTNGQLGHGDVKNVWYPFLIKSLLGKGVVAVGTGYDVTFAITGAGKVFGCGSSAAGKLGNGDVDGGIGGNVYIPALLKGLQGDRIVQATGGKNFSMFLTEAGQLKSVGYASNGQLGISFKRIQELDAPCTGTIQEVEHKGAIMRMVRCGDAHTLALADNGLVYTWGSGIDWTLGHGNQDDVLTPKLVAMIEADPCVAVDAGGCHSAAISNTGRLYVWGRGFIGQLGLGHRLEDEEEHVQQLPTSVKFNKNNDMSELAQRVGCGHCHTVLQTGLAGDEVEEAKPQAAQQPKEKPKAEERNIVQVTQKVEKDKPKKQFLTLIVDIVSARNLLAKDDRGTSDPYCKVKVKEGRVKQKEKTKVCKNTCDPVWNQTFTFKGCCNRVAVEGDPRMAVPGQAPELNWDLKLKISCADQDMMGADENLGVLFVPLAGLPLNQKRDIWVPLAPKIEGQPVSGDVRLRLLLTDA
jgi:alpha-tubulin suppressor-like RCC1 family protein